MGLRDLVINSQLMPPKRRTGILKRPRVDELLDKVLDYPLTLIQAGTGYGKTTALSILGEKVENIFWYTISETDRDPLLFLANFFSAFEQKGEPLGSAAFDSLEHNQGRIIEETLAPLLNALTAGLQRETVLVLDDYHQVIDVPEINAYIERFINFCPPRLHIVLATRKTPPFESLSRWRVLGRVFTIRRETLAFTKDEICRLFREQHQYELTDEQVEALYKETGGWVIALQMIWHNLQSGTVESVMNVIEQPLLTLEALFDYLASEVLSRQPEDIQRFLIASSVLRQMDPQVCDALLGANTGRLLLEQLMESGLFISSLGEDVYQYQNLFHDFLRAKLWEDPELARALNRQAADYYQAQTLSEQTIYHLLEAAEYEKAARLIGEIGQNLIKMGRFDSLLSWFASIPLQLFNKKPELTLLRGEISRLRSNFTDALDHYILSEKYFLKQNNALGCSLALRGQAQVYLDTIRPLRAESLLEEALKLIEPQEYHNETAALLDQLAENKLNLGYPDQANSLHHEAQLLRNEADPGDVYLEARAMLRTGNLSKARLLLEVRADEESSSRSLRPQRFHRETLLLLSLVCIFQGDGEAAEAHAQDGIRIGQHLGSTFVEAVGMIRKAHAYQLDHISPWFAPRLEEAKNLYEQAIEKVRVFKVTRVQVEPLWALSRLYGYQGQLLEAAQYAQQAMDVAFQAGDKWLGNLVKVNLAASYILAGQTAEALNMLEECRAGFVEVSDTFGLAAVTLWQAKALWAEGETGPAMRKLKELLALAKKHKYETLLTQPSFLGLKDANSILPLLLEARQQDIEVVYIEQLLRKFGLSGIDYHPGYTLVVQTLGTFEVFQGDTLISPADWQREKARQLFQLLLTFRGEWLQREQIVDRLWPDLGVDAALRDFKVALNALNKALEPSRPRGVSSFFIIRRENQYVLNPLAKILLDSEVFEGLASGTEQKDLKLALQVYQGDYLTDSLYNEWTLDKRGHLKQLYLMASEKLVYIYLFKQKWDESIKLSELILRVDRTWEAAYRFLMQAYAGKNNGAQVHAVYQRCVDVLEEELAIEPDRATLSLFQQLTGD